MTRPARVHIRRGGPENTAGRFVLYWMQQAQRARANPALEEAVRLADGRGLPVVVAFGLDEHYPDANLRHFAFMLEGLAETARSLAERGIGFVLRRGCPPDVALELARSARILVCDRGYLRHQRQWRDLVAAQAPCPVVEVEGEVVVPVGVASNRAEIGARTLRPKIRRLLDPFLDLPEERGPRHRAGFDLGTLLDPDDPGTLLATLDVDRSVPPVRRFRGGTSEAEARLARFLDGRLEGYAQARSDPGRAATSELSPYLHFGQISPVAVAAAVQGSGAGSPQDRAAFLEELVVRRELSCNFTWYVEDYDRFPALPGWARATLSAHARDPRPALYGIAELEAAGTHDPAWNAAMREMRETGYMHNYMRMYWGKKILEWSRTPEEAFATALRLDNRWFLDGRDPNGYAGVAWCFGLHDRPWPERPVFGTVRTMTAAGLARKFDIATYIRRVDALVRAENGGGTAG
jgi:deoxyribodipyrimidine photo-lyase